MRLKTGRRAEKGIIERVEDPRLQLTEAVQA
jgi:hypothetical protein